MPGPTAGRGEVFPLWSYTPAPVGRTPASARRRRGILGGTFDPPHLGHVIAAEAVRRRLGLDEVVLVVAHDPWQKSGDRAVTAPELRLAMTQLAVAGHDGLVVSDLELRRGGPTFTVDTLETMRAAHPDDDLVLILGEDAAAGIETWHRAADLPALCQLVVVCRPGVNVTLPDGWPFVRVDIDAADVSSTAVRSAVAAGADVRRLVPDEVGSFIVEHGLYRVGLA